jgi:uncharacterized protein (TIGR00251 family)
MNGLDVRYAGGKTMLGVKVVPGSSRTAIAGVWNGMLKVKVAAPPEDGKANKMLIKFLAEKLGVKARDVQITSGQTNPVKHVEIDAVIEPDSIAKLTAEAAKP